jgi:hypothetical protein
MECHPQEGERRKAEGGGSRTGGSEDPRREA